LTQEYAPKLLIVGIEALNFTVPREEQGISNLAKVPWVRYKLGEFVPKGWLYEQSYLYRYAGMLGQLVTFAAPYRNIIQAPSDSDQSLKDGYFPLEKPAAFDVSKPPNPVPQHSYTEHYFAALSDFQLWPENLEALDMILALNSETTRIVLVEMPVPDTFYTFFGRGEQDYMFFLDTISQKATAYDVPFWRIDDLNLLPSSVWFNYNHLNVKGAPIFSRWLGTRLGQERLISD
jgi:hypothetical protein